MLPELSTARPLPDWPTLKFSTLLGSEPSMRVTLSAPRLCPRARDGGPVHAPRGAKRPARSRRSCKQATDWSHSLQPASDHEARRLRGSISTDHCGVGSRRGTVDQTV